MDSYTWTLQCLPTSKDLRWLCVDTDSRTYQEWWMIGQMSKESQGNPCNQLDLILRISKRFYLFRHCYYYYNILFYIYFSLEFSGGFLGICFYTYMGVHVYIHTIIWEDGLKYKRDMFHKLSIKTYQSDFPNFVILLDFI